MCQRQRLWHLACLSLCGSIFVADTRGQAPDETVALLAPDHLDGWRTVSARDDTDPDEVWSVKDGVLTCTGQPSGYLITERDDFRDYILSLEWRWHTGRGGNNGVLVHCSTPGVLGVWCKSIEVQLADQNAGDFWIIGTQLQVPGEEHRRQGRRYQNLVDGAGEAVGRVEPDGNHVPGR